MPQQNKEPTSAMQKDYLSVFKTVALADILRDGTKDATYSKCKALAEWLEQNQNPHFAMQLLHFVRGYILGVADRKRRQ